ncbi:MAG: ABC transporter permease, partial [Deltaproteobacteria bacterium]|nr:ABC transporter permease [Deltaproteobacteria bacterium]
MKPAKLTRLVRGNLQRDLRSSIASALGVALGCGSLVFFLALGSGLSRAVAAVFPTTTRELEVTLPSSAISGLFDSEQKIDDAMVDKLAHLPGVEHAYPKMALRISAVTRYQGLFFGKELRMGLEVVGVGVPEDLPAGNAKLPFVNPPELTRPLPVIVNRRLLDLYNKGFAPQRGLPKLTESMLVGFTFPIELGRSWVAARTLPTTIETQLQLVGFSDRAMLAGVTLPLETVRAIHRKLGQDADTYTSVLLRARSSSEVTALAARVRELGLEIDEGERGLVLQVGAAVKLTALALASLSILITLLSAINVAQAFAARVRERRREIGILASVGATRSDVRALFLAEAASVGLAGSLLGVLGARLLALVLDHVAHTQLPDFTFMPEHF